MIVVFSVILGWLPSIYDTTLRVTDFSSFWLQIKQLIMPVMVLALYNAAQLSRFMRASMLDNLNQDYVRTARAKGLSEKVVLLVHVFAQQPDSRGYGDRAGHSADLWRCDYHRTDFPRKWTWTIIDTRH